MSDSSLRGDRRRVLITGCASGIGLATAARFAEAGDFVVATVRDPASAGRLRDRLTPHAASTEILGLDVTEERSEAVIADAIDRLGGLDVLVSNAGRSVEGTLEDLSIADLTASLDVNFLGAARVTRAVLPSMRRAGRGRIIAISSTAGLRGTPFGDAYCAAKFALEGLFECLEPVAAAHGVRLTLVEPGPVEGEFVTRASATVRGPSSAYEVLYERFAAIRSGAYAAAPTSEDIAKLIFSVSTAEDPPFRIQDTEVSTRTIASKIKDVDGRRVAASGAAMLRARDGSERPGPEASPPEGTRR